MTIKVNETNGVAIELSFAGFAGGERHLQIKSHLDSAVNSVDLSARIHGSDDVMDLLLVENALRKQFGADLSINLELPYLPYARQDRVCAAGQAFSLEVFARLLKSLNTTSLQTWDCHSSVGLELTGAKNISAAEIIASTPDFLALLQDDNSVLVCPDKGAVNRCMGIKQKFKLGEMLICEKRRNPLTGAIEKTTVPTEDLSGKCAVITDDICDGGYTFIKIAEQLREKNVEKIVLFVTHGIFSKGLKVFDGLIDEIVTTNSFPQQENKKLNVINFNYQT